MDIAEHSTRKNHSDSTNVKEYDSKKSGGVITTNGEHDGTKHIDQYRSWKKQYKASGLKALQVLFV